MVIYTYGFEIVVQVVLADHLVFTDKVLAASHFSKAIICYICWIKKRLSWVELPGLTELNT